VQYVNDRVILLGICIEIIFDIDRYLESRESWRLFAVLIHRIRRNLYSFQRLCQRDAGLVRTADYPEAAQTSASRYISRYLATTILFTRLDIAGHSDSVGCNSNSNSNQQLQRQRDARRSPFGSNLARALRRE